MTALSIRHMNFTLREMELIRSQQEAEEYANLPAEAKAEELHYWYIERKAKRGKKWIFVRDFIGTKSDVAELFCKKLRDGQHRLRHIWKYGA